MVWYKGREYKVLKQYENRIVLEDKDEHVFVLDKNWVHDTKEKSLANWEPYSLHDIQTFHILKFGKQDDLTAFRKVVEEIKELQQAIDTISIYATQNGYDKKDPVLSYLLEKCAEEYADIIQAGSCLFDLNNAMFKNFKKVGTRIYSDGYRHDED